MFAVTQSAMQITNSAITADTALNAGGFTATVVDPSVAQVRAKIPALGVDATVDIGGSDVKLASNDWLRLSYFPTQPELKYALTGTWELLDPSDSHPLEFGAYVAGYQSPAAGMPTTGRASYYAPLGVWGQAFYPTAAGGLPYTTLSLSGQADLTVDFSAGTVSGGFTHMTANQITGGAGMWPWNTVGVTGLLSATGLTGTTTSYGEPASTYAFGAGSGSIRGNFYGPSADEVAGIWTLTDGTNSAVGFFGAPTSTSAPPVVLPATIGAAEAATVGSTPPTTAAAGLQVATGSGPKISDSNNVGMVFALTQSTLKLTDTTVAADSTTDAAGGTLTYTGFGFERAHLKLPGLGVDIDQSTFNPTLPDGRAVSVTADALNYVLGGDWSIQGTTATPTSEFGYFIAGFQSPSAGVPTGGTATYSRIAGVSGSVVVPPLASSVGQQAYANLSLSGDVSLTVDFGSGALTGALTNMKATGSVPWNDVALAATLSGTTFSGTTATTSTPSNFGALGAASGTLKGGFYGPQADEVGAVWTLSDGRGTAVGTLLAPMASNAGLIGGGLQAVVCCSVGSPTAGMDVFSFRDLNVGAYPLPQRPPVDGAQFPLSQFIMLGTQGHAIAIPAPYLTFSHVDSATGKATLTFTAWPQTYPLTDLGPGDPTDAEPAELYSGTSNVINVGSPSPTVAVALRHLDWLAFGSWSQGDQTAAWIAGYKTPATQRPTTGAAVYAGHTYGAVNVTVGGATVQGALRGDANLNVDFASGQIGGGLSNMTVTPSGGAAEPWNNVSITATLSGADFNGTTAATSAPGGAYALGATATGQVSGSLYGFNAEELGAVWTLHDASGQATGAIGARKQ